jgi:uncharacterized YigZ family protein
MNNYFYTVKREVELINRVKDSKFFANINMIKDESQAKEFIEKIKKRYHDATHNVYAYKLGSGDTALKYYDDDGEPAGSSGKPVLQALESKDLTNTIIVISRYFGGTKLGIGGLIRAYGDIARLAIYEAGSKKLNLYYKVGILGNYNYLGIIFGQLESANGKILSVDYINEGAHVLLYIKVDDYNNLKSNLIEMTSNRVDIVIIEKLYK